jgi:hypothetical protein
MANHALLNNVEHQHLKINPARSTHLGDGVWYSETFVSEFRVAQAHYPIFFTKDDITNTFSPVCLYGINKDENLFLVNQQWQAHYIPLSMQRLPFAIATQNTMQNGVATQERMLSIDLDSPKVSTKQGINLFLEHGGNSDYLENVINVLDNLHHGLQQNQPFIKTLIKHGLLESVSLELDLVNGLKHSLLGFYTINEDTLNQLSSDAIAQLHSQGYLACIYMVIASQVHVRDLVALKNEQLMLQKHAV